MQILTEQEIDANRLARLAAPVLVFFALMLGVPLYDNLGGGRPLQGLASPTLADVLDGRAARSIESSLAANSRFVRDFRPRYQEILYLGLGRVQNVALGRDRWLFQRSTVYRPPRASDAARVEEHADHIRALTHFFASHGCDLLCVPVPTKATLYPDQRPSDALDAYPAWRALLRHLRDREVWTVDVVAAMDPALGPAFYRNNTHWTYQAANRVAEEVAETVRARFEGDPPGRPCDGVLFALPPRNTRGDLQRGLGFEEGSWVDRLFDDEYVKLVGLDARTNRPLDGRSVEDVVLVGTSFSQSFGLASLLSVALGRAVQDSSVDGKGPMVKLDELIQAIQGGTRSAPRVVVWEFPEKHLFSHRFLGPLEITARRLADAARYESWEVREIAGVERLVERLALEAGEEGWLVGAPTGKDPYIELILPEPLPADGTWAVRYTVRADDKDKTKVRFNFGDGLDRSSGIETRLVPGRDSVVTALVEGAAGQSVYRIRIDPVDEQTSFRMSPVAFMRSQP